MNHATLTYGQLHKKLQSLGYHQKPVEIDGKSGEMFEHDEAPSARILLPKRNEEEPVESMYMNYVLMVLRTNGILEEVNPLLS